VTESLRLLRKTNEGYGRPVSRRYWRHLYGGDHGTVELHLTGLPVAAVPIEDQLN
jgi:hypothetical protein